ncbi:MAG: carboxypeptidase-like regulatory domain-containing protein [Bacilli bacterium]|nr:carboxypeptidase-like regulatory domain-containing protein [Bacilli bacterium]
MEKNKKTIFKTIFKDKKPKTMMAIWVFILTVCTIGVSYSAFFSVRTNKNNQTVTTGNLSVAYGNSSSSIIKVNMLPMSDEEGLAQNEASIIYIQNDGTIDADYVLTMGYDMESFLNRSDYSNKDKLTPIDYIKFAIYEYAPGNSTLICGPMSIADLPVYSVNKTDSRKNRYAVLFDKLGTVSDRTKTYQVKIWLSDKATSAVSSSFFYVNSEIVAEAESSKMAYTINGILKDKNGNRITGATISLQNNSFQTTTANGNFSLPNVLPGTYNIDINYNNQNYNGNLTIREGTTTGLINVGSTFTASSNMDLATAAYTYGTTINKLIKTNNITTNSSAYTFKNGKSYNLSSSYILTGGSQESISNLSINLNDNGQISLTLN